MKRNVINFLILWCTSLFLYGCSPVNTYMNTYTLNNICPKPHCCGATNLTLLVPNTTANSGYETEQMLYVDCPFLVQAYSQNRWLVPPHQMLTPLIAQRLRNCCFFHAVILAPSTGCSDYRLETRLVKLQQEFLCCPSRIHMVLYAALINNRGNCIIADQTFTSIVLAPKNNPYGGVRAANCATSRILDCLAEFVIRNIRGCCYFELEPPNYRFLFRHSTKRVRGAHNIKYKNAKVK